MTGLEAAVLVLLGFGIGTAGLIEWDSARRRAATWQTRELRFGREVSEAAVLGVLRQVSGMGRGRVLVLDTVGSGSGIQHFVSGERATLEAFGGVLRGLLPGSQLGELCASPSGWQTGRLIRMRGRLRLLRLGDHASTAAALLGALYPLGESERVMVRWVLFAGQIRPRTRALSAEPERASDAKRAERLKQSGSLVQVRGMVVVRTGAHGRARQLLGRVSGPVRARSTSTGQLRLLDVSGWLLRWAMAPVRWPLARLNVDELAGLLAWPIDEPKLPGVQLGTSPVLVPSASLPTRGRVFGDATAPGADRPIAQPVVGALSHGLIAAPTGAGKSALLVNLAVQDIAPPVTIKTRPLPPATANVDELRQRSAERFGRSTDEVDAALTQRHQLPTDASSEPIGRRPRRSL